MATTAATRPTLFSRHDSSIPIFAGFRRRILPVIAILWAVLLGGWALTREPVFWALIPWTTVTTLMLWPVARGLGHRYLSYRTPMFLLGVLSMGYIIFTGLAMQSHWPYSVKLVVFLLLPIDLTVFAILPSLRWGIGRPVRMLFRPDLIFGDGRVLCCGVLALVLGVRYFVGHPAAHGLPIPIPAWNWWAIMWAIGLGFVPLIAIRGVFKILLRVRRIRDDRWYGWPGIVLRELLLVGSVLSIGWGFHNAFHGSTPFVQSHTVFHQYSWVPLSTLLLATLFLVFVRGGYKKHIGEPFIRETLTQTWIKELLLAGGVLVLMWSFMSILDTEMADVVRAGYHPVTMFWQSPGDSEMAHDHMVLGPAWPAGGYVLPGIKGANLGLWNWVGLALVLWGLIVLVPFRVLAQHHQRHAIVAQMAAVIVPGFSEPQRLRVLGKLLSALHDMPVSAATAYMRSMLEALDDAGDSARASMAEGRVGILAQLPAERRNRLMEGMAGGLGQLGPEARVRAIGDMMSALTALPPEQRRPVVEKMAAMLSS